MLLKKYLVISPEFETYSQTEIDPPEWGCDVVTVEAENKRDALVLGIKLMRIGAPGQWEGGQSRRYLDYCSDENPFTNMKVEELVEEDVQDSEDG